MTLPIDHYIALPEPNPEWSPRDVIAIQLQALRHNNSPRPDTGIRVAFLFASPANKVVTGPLDRFCTLVKSPLYAPLINHQQATFESLIIQNLVARLSVTILSADGDRIPFVFILSRQPAGRYSHCWLTDAVLQGTPPHERDFTD